MILRKYYNEICKKNIEKKIDFDEKIILKSTNQSAAYTVSPYFLWLAKKNVILDMYSAVKIKQ